MTPCTPSAYSCMVLCNGPPYLKNNGVGSKLVVSRLGYNMRGQNGLDLAKR